MNAVAKGEDPGTLPKLHAINNIIVLNLTKKEDKVTAKISNHQPKNHRMYSKVVIKWLPWLLAQ